MPPCFNVPIKSKQDGASWRPFRRRGAQHRPQNFLTTELEAGDQKKRFNYWSAMGASGKLPTMLAVRTACGSGRLIFNDKVVSASDINRHQPSATAGGSAGLYRCDRWARRQPGF